MLVQRQNGRPSKPSVPRVVTLVLAGRTTLSEHLPGETINVSLSIASHSPHLRALIEQHASTNPPSSTIELRGLDPAGFKLYLEWLTTKSITYPFRSQASSSSGLLLQDCIDLIYAHIVGSHLEEPEFQDYIIDEIARRLDPAQAPDAKLFEVIFVEKGASSVLKRFVVDKMFALERRMLGMLRGVVEDVMGQESEGGGCEYHVHGDRQCYRNGSTQQTRQEAKTGNTVWNADDDVDLKSIAAGYLGNAETSSFTKEGSFKTEFLSTEVCDSRFDLGKTLSSETEAEDGDPDGSFDKMFAPDPHYFGSAAWSREVHGSRKHTRSLVLCAEVDKPLPALPSTPLCQPSAPLRSLPSLAESSPLPHLNSTASHRQINTASTQDLVSECLTRLSLQSTDTPTQALISECLSLLALASSTASESPLPTRAITAVSSEPSLLKHEIPASLRARSPLKTLPRRKSLPASLPACPVPPPYFHHSPAVLRLPPLVRRKPAPPRGLDWVEQWERLDELKGTQGFGLMRGERRSRFKEMLGSQRDGLDMTEVPK